MLTPLRRNLTNVPLLLSIKVWLPQPDPHPAGSAAARHTNSRIKPYMHMILSLTKSSRKAYTMSELLKPMDAAQLAGVSYPTLKQWIYKGKIHTTKTAVAITALRVAKSSE
jgi:hypothetical protein